MLKKKGVVVAAVALMFLFLASPVFANDDHYVLSAECNGVTLSKAVLYSGYNPPNGEWVTSDPMTGLHAQLWSTALHPAKGN